MKLRLAFAFLLVALLLGTGCSTARTFDTDLDAVVQPHAFNILRWEMGVVSEDIRGQADNTVKAAVEERAEVEQYFALAAKAGALKISQEQAATVAAVQDEKQSLERTVRAILSRQIGEVLAEEGIYNPFQKFVPLKIPFPPVYFRLEEPPNLLVISPRDRIEYTRGITLNPNMSLEQMVELEDMVDKLGVSSLVVQLGGIATYPSFVVADFGLRFALDVITEEWLHQYLTFQPVGFLYALHLAGIRHDPDAAKLDETVASIASKEIGNKVYQKFYAREETKTPPPVATFDFNREMRDIRKTVDEMLARGDIAGAEGFMNDRRDFLATKGYHIRKLNQAYFAFYGNYTDSPISTDDLGDKLKKLREQSGSLKAFLDVAGSLTSRSGVEQALQGRLAPRS